MLLKTWSQCVGVDLLVPVIRRKVCMIISCGWPMVNLVRTISSVSTVHAILNGSSDLLASLERLRINDDGTHM